MSALLGTATTTKSSGVATFTVNGVDVSVQVARDLTIAVGDVCLVEKIGAQWFALARFYVGAPSPPENVPPPPPKPSIVYGTLVCSPVETRSYRAGGWRSDNDDVYQGEYNGNGNHTGCAFYGSKPSSLSGATALSASIKVRRPSRGGASADRTSTLWLVTEKTRPGGAPSRTSSTTGPTLRWGESDTFTIPTSWAQSMIDGTTGGLALYDSGGSPYMILSGRGDYSASFTLSIRWSR